MADEQMIEISRALGRIEGSLEARFDHVNRRLDFQDDQRDLLVAQVQALANAPKIRKAERKKAVAKWAAGAIGSIVVALFVAVAKGCSGN